jgi:FkbM family methyltransferase
MADLRRFVPTPLRPLARKGLSLLRRWVAVPATPTVAPPDASAATSAFETESVLRLVYGAEVTDATRTLAHGALNGEPVRDLGAIRLLLGSLDRQVSPTPMMVRFRRADLQFAQVEGLTLALDTADASVCQPIAAASAWEPHLTAVFRRFIQPGQHVIDVGANVGYFTVLAGTLVGPTGWVTAIEPNSENCRLILASADANQLANVELIPVALDQQKGWAHFSTHIGSNGGLRPNAIDAIVDDAGQIVPVFALDDLITRPVHFLKIDVEGAEHRAMQGASRLIERDRPIVSSEFSVEMIERISGVAAIDYLQFFTSRGYGINVIDRADGCLRPYASASQLLDTWPDRLHLEDLLFLPS